ncbi:MAG: hypothetical protein ACLQVY_20445 [Limisphaerales bacterium]
MIASKIKRFYIALMGLVFALILYVGAYCLCVSIQFEHNPAVMEESVQSAGIYYKVSPSLETIARCVFEPAWLCDAYYFRPKLWEDRQKPVATTAK